MQVERLELAIKSLMEMERRDVSHRTDKAHTTEKARRANNIIFYASRMVERGGGEALATLVSEAELEVLAADLAPNGVDHVTDPDVLHTLGSYFAARRRSADALQVGGRILAQISKRLEEGVITNSDSILLGEASEWVQAASTPSVAGSGPHSTNNIQAGSIVP